MAVVISSSLVARSNRVTTFSIIFAPLQALLGLFMPVQSASAMLRYPTKQDAVHEVCNTRSFNTAPWRLRSINNAPVMPAHPAETSSRSRLKIVRAFEPGVSPACAGRMVITGRMADVCAELDRLAQSETA